MAWDRCVVDASMGCRGGLFTFCPVEGDLDGDFSLVTGMNYVAADVPDGMTLVGIVHPDGQAAVEAFCLEHAEALDGLKTDG